jgi:hypothetical protein
MKWLRGLRERLDMFDMLSLGLLALLTALALGYWSKFPVHADSFYHMGVTSGYASAGGISLHSFWEYAPVGRAQLYPPLLHVLMFALTKMGLSIITVGRLVSFAAFPLIVLSSWYGMRRLFSSKAAFYSTVLLSSVYLLFWHSAVESAASLTLILTPLVFVAVEKDRKVAAAILLALALYSHLVLGHLIAFGLLIYAVHRRKMFKEIFLVLAGAYLLWLPWGIHILVNYRSLSFSDPVGGTAGGVTVHLLIWAVGLAGFVYCYFKKDRYYLLPSFLLGTIPIVFFYPDRFWNAHGFVPLAMLGGVALAGLHEFAGEKVSKVVRDRAAYGVVMTAVVAIPVALFLLLDPVYSTGGGGPRPGVAALARQQGAAGQLPVASGSAPARPQVLPQAADGNLPLPPPIQMSPNGQPVPGSPGDGVGQNPPAGAGIQGQGLQGLPPGPGAPGAPGAPGGFGLPGGTTGLNSSSTTILSLLGGNNARAGQTLDSQALINSNTVKLAELVKANSTPDQIVYCADGMLSNLITGITGRASTSGMFHEVQPEWNGNRQAVSPANSHLIVVQGQQQRLPALNGGARQASSYQSTQIPGGPQGIALNPIDTSKYKLVGTAGNYSVYLNTAATATTGGKGTVIPWRIVFALLGLAFAAAAIDWFRPGPLPPAVMRDKAPGGTGGTGKTGRYAFANVPGAFPQQHGLSPREPAVLPREPGAPPHRPGARKEVLAIVPCFNEAANVARVVTELDEYAPFLDILVVDDGSSDATAVTARNAGAIVVSHTLNRGIGAAAKRTHWRMKRSPARHRRRPPLRQKRRPTPG